MLRFKASFEFFSSSVVYFEPNKRWFKFELALFLRQIPDMKVCESDMMMMMMMLCMYTIWLCSIGSKQTKQQQKSIGIMYDFRKTTEKQIATNTNQIICSKSQDFYHLYYVFIRKFKKIFPSLSILFTIIAWSVCECACVRVCVLCVFSITAKSENKNQNSSSRFIWNNPPVSFPLLKPTFVYHIYFAHLCMGFLSIPHEMLTIFRISC